MSLSDCAMCWDTPCSCGESGYLSIYPQKDHGQRLRSLSYPERMRIREQLRARLEELLPDLPPPAEAVEPPLPTELNPYGQYDPAFLHKLSDEVLEAVVKHPFANKRFKDDVTAVLNARKASKVLVLP